MSLKTKRFFAFLLDLFIVMMVSTAMSNISAVNPTLDKYQSTSKEYMEVYNEYLSSYTFGGSSMELPNIKPVVKVTKKLQKYNVYTSIWYLVFLILYIVVFQYFNDGQTLGKKIMKLKLVKKDTNERPGFIKMLFRSLFIGTSLFYGVTLSVILRTILPFITSDTVFYYLFSLTTLLSLFIELLLFIFLFATKGKQSLHDKILKTEVIELN